MEYTIQIPKDVGHIVPLSLVAHGIAKGFATRWGELSFHQPTYENALRQATINLIHAAQEGDLTACDMHGRVIRLVTDEMVITSVTHRDWPAIRNAHPECEITPDFWDFSSVDLGPAVVTEEPVVDKLFATLRDLNAWAEGRGDRFSIEEMPVQVIERDGLRAIISGGNAYVKRPDEDGESDSSQQTSNVESHSGTIESAGLKIQAISGVDRSKPNVTVHKMRRNSLDGPIEKAIELAGNRHPTDVWVQLKELALNERAPLTGVADDGAIEYTNDDNKKARLTKDALNKRIKRL